MIRKLTVLLWLAAAPAIAQQATFRDDLVGHLAGKWVLTGEIARKQITHDVTAAWVLNHQYLEFRETSREKNADGSPYYDAAVYIGWDESKKHYVCVWLDDFGSISTQSLGYAMRKGDSIPFVFQDRDDAGKFHTTFSYLADSNSWTMNMDQETDGKLTPFARTTLTPAK
ncbi:MAG TPA: hypothetical protein VG867_05030 [Rhizomicrobium sp.]|nr:hypothetical protein [Rhizomicrobium sp.]